MPVATEQDEVIAFLASESGFGAGSAPVRTVVTHISTVLLIGERAIKLKRAVHLPYADFSTPERRLAACERELVLNRRTAPSLYRAVHRITRQPDGSLARNGDGPLVDAVVEMGRFDENGLFDRMAVGGSLTGSLMTRLALQIATFHASAPTDRRRGGAAAMAAVLDLNEQALSAPDVFPPAEVARLNTAFREGLERHAPLLDRRARNGSVRRCHGDLHLRNICLVEGEPTLFDCLEFDEALATTDVLYDLAFLLMDLWHRDMESLANIVFNRYLDQVDEEDGLPALPFFMAVRAAIRAHVTGAQAALGGPDEASRREEARAYLDLALALLEPQAPRLVAVGGLSGSGKSTVAAALAPIVGPAPGARILASDRIRKRRFGVTVETRLPAEAYRPEISAKVYAELFERAGTILRGGHGVVADAVFDRPPDRERIAAAAAHAGADFAGLWLEAPTEALLQRVAGRRGDPSDATPEVVVEQVGRLQSGIEWTRIPAGGLADIVSATARRAIAADHPGAPPPALTGSGRE